MGTSVISTGMWARSVILARRTAAAVVAAMATFACLTPALAAARHAAMVIDGNTGETLLAEAADEARFPASLTKMMTLYMVFEMIEAGRLTPTTKLKVSQEAAAAQPTKLDLEPGEQIAVLDAVKALITKSANDMAIVLAEAIGGSEQHFAELMTEKARAVGMRNTTFRNASGLPDSRQVTTARDMLTLALRLQDDFPKYYPLFATRAFTYNGATMRNHNTLLGAFEGIDGIKTGYTRVSGFNLVTSLRRGDKHLVAAVFGGATAGTRNATMRLILTRALLKASTKKTRRPAASFVARAKPAPQHVAPAQRVAKAARSNTAAPVAGAAPAPSPVAPPPALRPQQAAAVAAQVVEPAADEPPVATIEIARVRTVMVAARIRSIAPPGPAAAEAPEPRSLPIATFARSSPEPASFVPESAPVARPALQAAPPAPPAAAPPTNIQRGAAPSTLQAQAQSLNRSSAVPQPSLALPSDPPQRAFAQADSTLSRLRGPNAQVASATSAVDGDFHIQIGAYASAGEAERILKETQTRASTLLTAARPVTAPVQKENRLLYRARFAGFDAKRAASTCLELRRAAIDCFVMKAE